MELPPQKTEELQGPQTALVQEKLPTFLNSVDPFLQDFAVQHYTELKRELSCSTVSENELCGLAAAALARHHSASRLLKELTDEYWSSSNRRTRRPTMKYTGEHEETWFLVSDYAKRVSVFSKEVDRSLRQYQSIIAQLRQIKSPVPEVKIQTAFMAQNQQFNAENGGRTEI